MNYPEECEVCKSTDGFITRASLDFDGYDDDRMGDEIMECIRCHTLYRSRWRMVSFTRLFEVVKEIEGNVRSIES